MSLGALNPPEYFDPLKNLKNFKEFVSACTKLRFSGNNTIHGIVQKSKALSLIIILLIQAIIRLQYRHEL